MSAVQVDSFVERMGAALTQAGLPRLPARVFAALVIDADGRMTSVELSEQLAVSPAAISGAVGLLSQINFIHRERERGSRRDIYVVDDDAWRRATLRMDQAYAPMVAVLGTAIAGLDARAPARHRLMLMRDFLLFFSGELAGIAERWLEHRAQLEGDLGRRAPHSSHTSPG